MKCFLFVAISLMCVQNVWGQGPSPAKMSSSTQPSSSIPSSDSIQSQMPKPKVSKKESLPTPVAPPSLYSEHAEYLHPGILVNLHGKWEGSDHLLNVSNNIGVYVSIVKPETESLDVSEAQLKKEVENIFSLANIKPETIVTSGKPPLPAFEIEIFVYPIERGYVACCGGRLFESVVLERFKMDANMAFQAVTWEKQHLIVSPKDQFAAQLTTIVQDIAKTFTDRYQVYEKIKRSL